MFNYQEQGAHNLVEPDGRSIDGDVHALLDDGVIQRTAEGTIDVPFEAASVDFMLAQQPKPGSWMLSK